MILGCPRGCVHLVIRPKLFSKFLAVCVTPLFLLGLFNYLYGLRSTKIALHRELGAGLTAVTTDLNQGLRKREEDLVQLARSESVQSLFRTSDKPQLSSTVGLANASEQSVRAGLPEDLKLKLAFLLSARDYFGSIAFYDPSDRPMLLAKPEPASHGLRVYSRDFPPGLAKPDERARTSVLSVVRSPLSITSEGTVSTLTVPVWGSGSPQTLLGLLVAEQKLHSLFSEAARSWDLTQSPDGFSARAVVILDSSGKILYHSNQTLLHQPVDNAMQYFMPAAQSMLSGQSGFQTFSSGSAESEAAYAAVPVLNISVAVVQTAHPMLTATRRSGWLGLIIAISIGVLAAVVLTRYFQRKTRGIEKLSEGVAEIAKGKLDHRIEVPSSVDMQPLAADVNALTAQLREQVAREAEAQQFQSFVRLSAMLTHDLKNAIEALSLIVGNMDRNFDNEEFRADAMKSLNLATQNLRSLVTRLTNPVTTLSGEYKRPQVVDLVPVLKQAIDITAGPAESTHRIESRLPASLPAVVDSDRIGKVIENLIMNALEAMSEKGGRLTIEGGNFDEGRVFFSVSDTGIGMSPDFIESRLYHPFATTKKRGVGLGLYTCREVVRASGGDIKAESKVGVGTTFRVVLPSAPGGQISLTQDSPKR